MCRAGAAAAPGQRRAARRGRLRVVLPGGGRTALPGQAGLPAAVPALHTTPGTFIQHST